MTACLFGTYVRPHSANRLLSLELAGAGWSVEELHEPLWEETRDKRPGYFAAPSLVRLGAFHVGDVVRYKDALAEVMSVRPFVVLRDLGTGESRRFKAKDVRSAKRVDAERFEAKIEHLESGQIVAVHPESEEARPVRPRPPNHRTARAIVVWTQDGAYLSLLPAETSKP